MENQKEFSGYNGTILLTNTGVVIKRGVKGFLLGGMKLRGDKTIPYDSIVAVQLKKAGLTAGYMQLTLKGGSEAKSGLFQSTTDENSVNFYSGKNKEFEEAKRLIEAKISRSNQSNTSSLDEIEKLAELRKKNIITQEEFDLKKKSLLGL